MTIKPKIAAQHTGKDFSIWNGDCVEVTRGLPDNSIGLCTYSPPFESLYVFSDDPRDMSNCNDKGTFWAHFNFLIREYQRALKPGRIAAVHCMNLPTSKTRDGFIGIRDFRGEVIRAHCGSDAADIHDAMVRTRTRAMQAMANGDAPRANKLNDAASVIESDLKAHPGESGFIYHSEVMIRKDPVSAAQRSKSIGLLHKQLCKDSTISRMALADYLVMFRKPGDNPEPVSGPFDTYYGDEAAPDGPLVTESAYHGRLVNRPGDPWYSVATWQRYAESCWMDINQSDVLRAKNAKEHGDERHISPLQLTVIMRAIDLWSNPGDVVYSPFAGIGSELYVALQMGRKAIGAELKKSYYEQAIKNCEGALSGQAGNLLDALDVA